VHKYPSVVIGYAAATLANLSLHPACADELVQDGVVEALTGLLSFKPEEEGVVRVDTVLISYAAAALRCVLTCQKCQ
jgi:hypothetical protein